jgi:hypothetical protein
MPTSPRSVHACVALALRSIARVLEASSSVEIPVPPDVFPGPHEGAREGVFACFCRPAIDMRTVNLGQVAGWLRELADMLERGGPIDR